MKPFKYFSIPALLRSVEEIHVNPHKICLTPDCVKVSAAILSASDSDANPCEDFYAYACGGWER